MRRFWADHRGSPAPTWNAPYTPEFNLIERYWGRLKAKAIHDYFFGDVDRVRRAIGPSRLSTAPANSASSSGAPT